MTQKSLPVILSTLFLISASCAAHDSIPLAPGNIQALIEPGDKVRIVTKDNEETEFVVAEVTDEAIVGENVEIAFADITKLEEETASTGDNTVFNIFTIGVMLLCLSGGNCLEILDSGGYEEIPARPAPVLSDKPDFLCSPGACYYTESGP